MERHPASYRDPSGYVFRQEGTVFRAVMNSYREDYDQLMQSGLYQKLVAENLLLPHEEVAPEAADTDRYKTLLPEQLSFQSYPYEWSFDQLKDAALATLRICETALDFGMALKDASAFNLRMVAGKVKLIDTLSFERYEEGAAWQAFNQFCRHFLYPLLAQHWHPGFRQACMMSYPDGLPASFVQPLLSGATRFSLNYQLYVHLPAKLERGSKATDSKQPFKVSKKQLLQNLQQLYRFIQKLRPKAAASTWNNYYDETILSKTYLEDKQQKVRQILLELRPGAVTDLGCNTGAFSIMAAEFADQVIAADSDALSVNRLYQQCRKDGIGKVYPLVADLANPTPALGWGNKEQEALLPRIKAHTVLALALIHHLAIALNVPLAMIAETFAGITEAYLIAEFVPKDDPKVQQLLLHRKDIFGDYTQAAFEQAFGQYFSIDRSELLAGSKRILYLLRKNQENV